MLDRKPSVAGVLVRHLVTPSLLPDPCEIMHWLTTTLSRDTYVNVMDQYHPTHKARTASRFASINRCLRDCEFGESVNRVRAVGLWRFDMRC